MSKKENVSYGKPKVSGAVSVAPVGTELPTDASSSLDPAFKSLGYISEDGLTNADTRESEPIKAWGGDIVLTTQTDKTDTFVFRLIESLNVDVLKFVYGEANVTTTEAGVIKVNSNIGELDEVSIVVDMVLRNALKRIVISHGKVIEVADIVYNDTEAVGYETTVQAYNDENGNSHIEYIEVAE